MSHKSFILSKWLKKDALEAVSIFNMLNFNRQEEAELDTEGLQRSSNAYNH